MHKNLLSRLSLLQYLQFFVWGSWFVTAGTYFLENLKFSGREVALIYSLFSIGATITPVFLGMLADRLFSVEKLLAFLHFVGALLLLTLSFLPGFMEFYVVMFLYVLCYVPTFSLSSSLCFHHIDDPKNNFPKVRVWGTIAWIMASSLIGFLNIEDQVLPFRIASASSFILALYCLTLPATPPQLTAVTKGWKSLNLMELKDIFKERSLAILLISVGLISVPVSYYYSFVNPFLNEVGVVNAAGKMALGQGVEIILLLLLPWFFTNWRFKTLVFIGLLIWGVRYGLFALGFRYGQEWMYMIGILLHGAAYIFSLLSVQIYLDTKVPIHLRSSAQGLFSFLTMGIMAIIGALIAGEFVHAFSHADGQHTWDLIWLFPAIFGTVVALLFFVLFRDNRAPTTN